MNDPQEIKRLLLQKEQLRFQRKKYEHDNRIEFFGIRDPKRALEHNECCRLFRGPNPIQSKLLTAWDNSGYKVFTLTGANRIGKTVSGTVVGLSVMFGEWLWNKQKIKFNHKHPRKVRYIGQDWEKHIGKVVEPELHKWWPKERKLGPTANGAKKNNFGIDAFWVDEKTGSSLEIMSNLQDPDLHEGWNGDLIIYDEPPKRDIRVANARGLVDRCGRELFCMTLLKEAWVDREVIRATNEDGTPDMSVFNIHGDIQVNVGFGLTQEGISQFAKTLKPEEKEARLNGKPSYLSSLIYGKYNRHTHLKKRLKVPLDWIVDIAIDFHPSKPWAVLFKATDRRNFNWVIDEIWENGSWKAIGEEIVRRIKRNNYRVGRIIIDPLAKGDEQSDLNEESVYEKMAMLFMKYGYNLYTASKDKEGGINMVQDLLMTENEMPALFFFDDLKRTVYEIEGYMIDPKTLKPSKEDDDMMENLYRLILLNTQWYELEMKDEDDVKPQLVHNKITGY
jgi:hypothetical protein